MGQVDMYITLTSIFGIQFRHVGVGHVPVVGEYLELCRADLDYLCGVIIGDKGLKKYYMEYVKKKNERTWGWVSVQNKDYKGLTPAQIRSKIGKGDWKMDFPSVLQVVRKYCVYHKDRVDVFIFVEFAGDCIETYVPPADHFRMDEVRDCVDRIYESLPKEWTDKVE